MLERASILRFAPATSSGQRGEYVEESQSHFFISSVSAFSLPFPIFTTHRRPPIALTYPPTSNPNPTSPHFSPFAVSYLIHNLGFSPQSASKVSSTFHFRFKTNQKPDLVLNFFRTYGFSDSQLRHMVSKDPWLLSCDPYKRILPKFQFFLSIGASTSDIINLFSKYPGVLAPSLDNHIVPTYKLLFRILQNRNDVDVLACVIRNPLLLRKHNVPGNITMLIENGVPDESISRLLLMNNKIFYGKDLVKLVEEVKDSGIKPSHSHFPVALHAKKKITGPWWEEKVDAYKKWGWSDEDVREAFRKYPSCMLISVDKINAVMDFWVNQGWDAKAIVKGPTVLGASMERKIIPRASVVQYLLKKDLRKKEASLTTPFVVVDKMFLDKYIKPFKEDSSYLLKLYEEKLNLARDKDNKAGTI